MLRSQSLPEDRAAMDLKERRLVILSRILFGFSIIVLLGGYAVAITHGLTHELAASPLDSLIFPIGIVAVSGIVGLLIISRYPDHAIGWLLLALGHTFAFAHLSAAFAFALANALVEPSGFLVEFLAWMDLWSSFPSGVITLVFIPLYFPTGRLLSSRWRFAALAGVGALLANTVAMIILPDPLDWQGAPAPNPFGLPGAGPLADFLIDYVSFLLMLVAILGAFSSVILRYRRADGMERAQMKWVLYVLMLGLIILSTSALAYVIGPEPIQEGLGTAPYYAIFLFAMAIPAVIGIAILRYRLYDIDLIIRKTLVYGLLTAALLLVYFGIVVLLQQLFTGISGQRSPVAIVISTLAIAALFRPLRQRIQDFIDRRFYRQSYDASQTLADFAATARDEVDLEQLTAELVRVIQQTMQPQQVGIWLAPMDGETHQQSENDSRPN